MTEYRTSTTTYSPVSTAARAAKAKRQSVLQRVRAQRSHAYKKTVAELVEAGTIFRGSDLKKRYEL